MEAVPWQPPLQPRSKAAGNNDDQDPVQSEGSSVGQVLQLEETAMPCIDGSGGELVDPRLRRCGWAFAIYTGQELEQERPRPVAFGLGQLSGIQTVPRAELQAAVQAMRFGGSCPSTFSSVCAFFVQGAASAGQAWRQRGKHGEDWAAWREVQGPVSQVVKFKAHCGEYELLNNEEFHNSPEHRLSSPMGRQPCIGSAVMTCTVVRSCFSIVALSSAAHRSHTLGPCLCRVRAKPGLQVHMS